MTFSRTPLKSGLDAAQHEHVASVEWKAWGEEAQHHPAPIQWKPSRLDIFLPCTEA